MLSTHYYLLHPCVCSSLPSVHCAVRLQNGSLPVLKDFSGKGGDNKTKESRQVREMIPINSL